MSRCAEKSTCRGCHCLLLNVSDGNGVGVFTLVLNCRGCIRCDNSNIIIVYTCLRIIDLSGGQRKYQCMIYFICYTYLRPYLSERRRQLILVLSFHRCQMPGCNVLLYIIPGTPFLVSHLSPIPWACHGRMSILNAEAAQETIVPIVETFYRIWGCRSSHSSAKVWSNLTADRRYSIILCCLGK